MSVKNKKIKNSFKLTCCMKGLLSCRHNNKKIKNPLKLIGCSKGLLSCRHNNNLLKIRYLDRKL